MKLFECTNKGNSTKYIVARDYLEAQKFAFIIGFVKNYKNTTPIDITDQCKNDKGLSNILNCTQPMSVFRSFPKEDLWDSIYKARHPLPKGTMYYPNHKSIEFTWEVC
jgi:hypothetical protein